MHWSKSSPPRKVSPFVDLTSNTPSPISSTETSKVPPPRSYTKTVTGLAEVASAIRSYHERTSETSGSVRLVQQLEAAAAQMRESGKDSAADDLESEAAEVRSSVPEGAWEALDEFGAMAEA